MSVRLNVVLSDDLNNELERVAMDGITKSDTNRRSAQIGIVWFSK